METRLIDKYLEETGENIDWTLSDLLVRYNVSRTKITGECFGYGIPKYKKGTAYHFDSQKVREWEIQQRRIPYGRNGYIILPAYLEYKNFILRKIEEARLEGNTEEVKRLKSIARQDGVELYESHEAIGMALVVLAIIAVIIISLI